MTGLILSTLRSDVPDLFAVYLFGSGARGQLRPSSDVDVALLAGRALPVLLRWELQERLAVLLHRDVDLVDLRSASAVLRAQVITSGHLLADLDPSQRSNFEMYALAAYARLNEERRPVLERIAREGTVLG